jgi:hypothetical protein
LRAEQHISAEVVILQNLVFVIGWFGIDVTSSTPNCTKFKAAIHNVCVENLQQKPAIPQFIGYVIL